MGPWTIAFIVISAALSFVLRTKPAEPKPPTLTSIEAPTADPERPIPVIFGTRRVTGPNVVWYGHLDTDAVRSDEL